MRTIPGQGAMDTSFLLIRAAIALMELQQPKPESSQKWASLKCAAEPSWILYVLNLTAVIYSDRSEFI